MTVEAAVRVSSRKGRLTSDVNGRGLVDGGEEMTFVLMVDRYKRVEKRPFPGWAELYRLLILMGWRRCEDADPETIKHLGLKSLLSSRPPPAIDAQRDHELDSTGFRCVRCKVPLARWRPGLDCAG